MSGSTQVWCEWFEALPPELARELALTVMRLFPGGLLVPPIASNDPTAVFVPRVQRLAPNPIADAGMALTLASLTDFVFDDRGDPTFQHRGVQMLELLEHALEQAPEALPEVDQFLESSRLGYPLRARQWQRERQGWADLRAGRLAANAIQEVLTLSLIPPIDDR